MSDVFGEVTGNIACTCTGDEKDAIKPTAHIARDPLTEKGVIPKSRLL